MKYTFTADDFSGKALGKADLQKRFNLPISSETPLFILTSRLAEQKGFEYLHEALAEAASIVPMQVLIIGDGEEKYVTAARELESRFPDKIRYSRFSTELEHLATAYGDVFVNGAWFEPSGLNQFFSLMNATLALVSNVGGLASSIRDGENGFKFDVVPTADGRGYDVIETRKALVRVFVKVAQLYMNDPAKIHAMRVAAMAERNSWKSRVETEFRLLFEFVLRDGPAQLAAKVKRSIGRVLSPSQMAKMIGLTKSRPQVMTCEAVFAAR